MIRGILAWLDRWALWIPWILVALLIALLAAQSITFARTASELGAVAEESQRLSAAALADGERCVWLIADIPHSLEALAWPRPVFIPADIFAELYRVNRPPARTQDDDR